MFKVEKESWDVLVTYRKPVDTFFFFVFHPQSHKGSEQNSEIQLTSLWQRNSGVLSQCQEVIPRVTAASNCPLLPAAPTHQTAQDHKGKTTNSQGAHAEVHMSAREKGSRWCSFSYLDVGVFSALCVTPNGLRWRQSLQKLSPGCGLCKGFCKD